MKVIYFYLLILLLNPPNVDQYHLYIPHVETPQPYFGLAMATNAPGDLDALGVDWHYTWTAGSDPPMLWAGEISPIVPRDYEGEILFLNEPNVQIQANVAPEEAARRLGLAQLYYPRAKILCCGVSVFAVEWVRRFWLAGGRPDGWHVHAYIESWITPEVAQSYLSQQHQITGGEYWITEYGSMAGDLAEFSSMTEWFMAQPWITRIAPYTNREPDGQWWSIGDGVELVAGNGTLTEIGAYYADVTRQRRENGDWYR